MDTNTVDIIGQRADVGLDLFIVLDQDIDNLPDEQTLLLDKIENYITYVESDIFAKDFPDVPKDKVTIRLAVKYNPSQQFCKWFEDISAWIQDNGIKAELEKG